MTHPSVNSIVERLNFDAARCEVQFSKGVAANITEAATIISELQAQNERKDRLIEAHRQQIIDAGEIMKHWQARALTAESSLSRIQCALDFWMPGVDSRLDEATRERAAQDALLLAGYTGPLDGPCWGDEMLDRLSRIKAETLAAELTSEQRECAARMLAAKMLTAEWLDLKPFTRAKYRSAILTMERIIRAAKTGGQ